jgi:hypothetical protein
VNNVICNWVVRPFFFQLLEDLTPSTNASLSDLLLFAVLVGAFFTILNVLPVILPDVFANLSVIDIIAPCVCV